VSELASCHDTLPELEARLIERGSATFDEVRARALSAIVEARGKEFRRDDLIALDEPGGLRLLCFLDPKRRRDVPLGAADLRDVNVSMVNREMVKAITALGQGTDAHPAPAP